MGVGPDTLVGLCVERSPEMIVGVLGILKAGGAYVPLDPAAPQERLAFMLADAQAPVLVTQAQLLNQALPSAQAADLRVVCLDTDWEAIAQESVQNPPSAATATNLAYVIYTSGSTGQPKGVLVEHANVVRLFAATEHWFAFDARDVWTLFHSYAFDFSVWELWGALLYGGRLVVVPYWISRTPEAFYNLLIAERVTVLNQTPSAFGQLDDVDARLGKEQHLSLRLVIFGGEALEPQRLRPWFERHGDRSPQLVNMYGITETTVHVTYRLLTLADLTSSASVIGRPIRVSAGLHPGFARAASADRRHRRAVCGRRRTQPGLSQASRADSRALCPRPLRRHGWARACTKPVMPHAICRAARSSTVAGWMTRSRSAASASSWAKSRASCASTQR